MLVASGGIHGIWGRETSGRAGLNSERTSTNTLITAPAPVDVRALRALNNSPLALDLYGWATYKTYAVTMKGQPQFVSYHDFMAQLGADYGTVKDFKKKLHSCLRKVQAVYPQMKIEAVTGGIRIYPSKPAVPPTMPRTLIP
jgi:hypothetical protein